MIRRAQNRTYFLIVIAGLVTALCGCAQLERLPSVTLSEVQNASVLGIADARFYPDRDKKKIEALALKVMSSNSNLAGLPLRQEASRLPISWFSQEEATTARSVRDS